MHELVAFLRSALWLLCFVQLSGCFTGVDLGTNESDSSGATESSGEPEDDPGPVGDALRRLTQGEYNRAVEQLLGDTTRPAQAFEPDAKEGMFAANRTGSVGSQQVSNYIDVAESVATRAVAEHPELVRECAEATDACARDWIGELGRRVFRRPLAEGELEAFVANHLAWATEFSDHDAVVLTVQALLSSPQFLYVLELGDGEPAGAETTVPLTPFELATRLSLFVWGSVPDDALLDAAETGELQSTADIQAQTERMLADPKAAGFLQAYFHDWLDVIRLEEAVKNLEFFPQWDEDLRASMIEETQRFVQNVFEQRASLATLFNASYTFVDARLAALYGVEAQYPGDGWVRVELDPAQRAGLLTQAGFLAGHAHGADPSVVMRGHFIRGRVLCESLPAPPADATSMEPEGGDRLEDPRCAGCHRFMDPLGKPLNIYDALGTHRLLDHTGGTIPTEGELLPMGPDTEGIAGPFSHPVELMQRLGSAEVVASCTARNLYAYAHRRLVSSADEPIVTAINGSVDLADVDLRTLAVAIATNDSFRRVGRPQ